MCCVCVFKSIFVYFVYFCIMMMIISILICKNPYKSGFQYLKKAQHDLTELGHTISIFPSLFCCYKCIKFIIILKLKLLTSFEKDGQGTGLKCKWLMFYLDNAVYVCLSWIMVVQNLHVHCGIVLYNFEKY